MEITGEQLSAYLKDKGATEECPFCGRDHWILPADEGGHPGDPAIIHVYESPVPLYQSHGSEPPMYMGDGWGIYFLCDNCGFMRMQSVRALNAWLHQNHGGASDV